MILCAVNMSQPHARNPQWVALSDAPCGPPRAVLPVSNIHARRPEYNFTVCLHKALMENYNNTAQLVEWVEVNRVFGAQHFVVYNFSSETNLLPFIDHYVKEGIMEYRRWPLNHLESQIENWNAQNGVMFDCEYRYMFTSKYLVMTDIDEVVVPRKHDTWMEMLHDSPCRNNSAANIKQVMFSLLYDVNPKYAYNESVSYLHLNSLIHNLRQNYTWPCGIRSKLIIQPDLLVTSGCHMSLTPD